MEEMFDDQCVAPRGRSGEAGADLFGF